MNTSSGVARLVVLIKVTGGCGVDRAEVNDKTSHARSRRALATRRITQRGRRPPSTKLISLVQELFEQYRSKGYDETRRRALSQSALVMLSRRYTSAVLLLLRSLNVRPRLYQSVLR